MINNIENGISPAGVGEKNVLVGPRQRLEGLLPGFMKQDALFVKACTDLPQTPEALLDNIANLLEMNLEGRQEKQKERQSAEQVNMMDILKPFNVRERIIIARNLVNIQMNDGCTVGCPQCGLEAQKGIKKAFSFDSFNEFMGKYGKYLQKDYNFALNRASDPFDWVGEEGKFSFENLSSAFRDKAKNKKLFVSTALPEGSELLFVKFMFYFASEFEGWRAEHKADEKNYLSGVRFSQNNKNAQRIESVMNILKGLGVTENFLDKAIKIVDREAGITKFRNIGRFVNSKDRIEDGFDMVGIECLDGLSLLPNGIIGNSMEAVTAQSSKGLKTVSLTPGNLEIPEMLSADDYEYPLHCLIDILPKIRYRTYKDGRFTGIKVVESVRRDALAFNYLIACLETLSEVLLKPKGREECEKDLKGSRKLITEARKDFIPRYSERKKSCVSLFSNESDTQAVRIAQRFIDYLDDWIGNINKKFGIDDSGKPI